MNLIHNALGAFTAAACVLGCQHESAVGTTTTTSAVTILNDTAIENVVYERCTHEYSCNNIGEGRQWDSLASCTTEQRGVIGGAIGREVCPRGVDAYALDACKNAIDRSPCTAARLPSECLKTQLCL